MAAGLPTVRIGRRKWRTPARAQVKFRAAAVETLAVGGPEGDVVGKQDVASCNRDVGTPEEDEFGKQDGEGCNRA